MGYVYFYIPSPPPPCINAKMGGGGYIGIISSTGLSVRVSEFVRTISLELPNHF